MVQTKEQYVLVHQAVRELFREQLRMIDSHPYENIDANGMPLVKEEPDLTYAPPTVGIPAENCSEG
jgi:tyrosine-protein phosphatase non-receptor type 12/18/22